MPVISNLWSYPVKSCKGTELAIAKVTLHGIATDRECMVVRKSNGNFISQRDFPKLALVQVSLSYEDCSIILNAPGMNECRFLPFWKEYRCSKVEVHKLPFMACEQSDVASYWFTHYLETDCNLVAISEKCMRERQVDGFKKPMNLACHDSSPIHLVGKESLYLLNDEIAREGGTSFVEMNRFRPNIVTEKGEAFDEDHWKIIQIGNVILQLRKPTVRCGIIEIDQETGEKTGGVREVITKMRGTGIGDVTFGSYFIPLKTGMVSVGQEIVVLERC